MRSPVLDVFRRLTSVPTAPFYEAAVARQITDWLGRELGRSARIRRHRGGLMVSYRGLGTGPALVLAAHMDHPGFHIGRVTRKGARAILQGGHPRELLEGCLVEAFPAKPRDNRPAALGVLGPPPKQGNDFALTWTSPPRPKTRLAFGVLSLTPLTLEDGWVSSRSIDDLLGCAIALETLRRAAKARLKTDLTVFLHRAEEVGFVGALEFARRGLASPEDSILSIEASRSLPGARPGKGPVIRLGDKAALFDGNLVALLDGAALALKRRRIPVQRKRLTGGTCEATAYQSFGYETAGVALPLVNYHNGIGGRRIAPEMVRAADAAGCVELLLEAARLFPAAALRGTWRRRLEARHRLSSRRLGATH
jgi:endoglucanase